MAERRPGWTGMGTGIDPVPGGMEGASDPSAKDSRDCFGVIDGQFDLREEDRN